MSAILRGKGYITFGVIDDNPVETEAITYDSDDIMVFESGVVLFLDPATGFQKMFPDTSYLEVCIMDIEYSALTMADAKKDECPRCHGDPQSLPLGRCPKGCRA
jgi:hypothetical protein